MMTKEDLRANNPELKTYARLRPAGVTSGVLGIVAGAEKVASIKNWEGNIPFASQLHQFENIPLAHVGSLGITPQIISYALLGASIIYTLMYGEAISKGQIIKSTLKNHS